MIEKPPLKPTQGLNGAPSGRMVVRATSPPAHRKHLQLWPWEGYNCATVYDLLKWLAERHWDAGASVLGVCISVVGFVVTLWNVARAKSAAEEAQKAAAAVREKLAIQSTVTDLAGLMAEIEEIKLLHRHGVWEVMPIRYAAIRKKLISVKADCPTLTRSQKSSIQGIVVQFKEIEELVEKAIAFKQPPTNVAALNKLAAEQVDKLTEVLVAVQQEMKSK